MFTGSMLAATASPAADVDISAHPPRPRKMSQRWSASSYSSTRRPGSICWESMGGALALDYMKDSSAIAGLILLAPALNVNSAQVFRLGNLPLLPYLLFARRHPAISLVGKRLEESSRDAQWIAERRADPLAYKKVR